MEIGQYSGVCWMSPNKEENRKLSASTKIGDGEC